MKRTLLVFALGIFVLTLQTVFLRFVPIQSIKPDFLLIYTLYLGFEFPPVSGGLLAFLVGYLVDLYSGNSFGLYAISRPLLFYGAYVFKSKFYMEGYPSQFIFVFASTVVEACVMLVLLSFLSPEPLFRLSPSFFIALLPQWAVTALITPILFMLFRKSSGLSAKKNGMAVPERG